MQTAPTHAAAKSSPVLSMARLTMLRVLGTSLGTSILTQHPLCTIIIMCVICAVAVYLRQIYLTVISARSNAELAASMPSPNATVPAVPAVPVCRHPRSSRSHLSFTICSREILLAASSVE